MLRLTDVQRGRAIALLMQGQRQQQVANHFGVNVSTIERLVRRLRETGHLADRPRSGRPRVTSRRQDRTIRLARLQNRHLTATVTALNTVGTHNQGLTNPLPSCPGQVQILTGKVIFYFTCPEKFIQYIGNIVILSHFEDALECRASG